MNRAEDNVAARGTEPCGRKVLPLLPLLLLLGAASASAQAPTSQWRVWQAAMLPDGSANPAIQFRWRSDPPCTDLGCRLFVQVRNVSHVPMRLRCFVYVDPPPLPYEDEVRPVVIDVLLRPFGSHTKKNKTGDTTSPLIIRGLSVSGVVVAPNKAK